MTDVLLPRSLRALALLVLVAPRTAAAQDDDDVQEPARPAYDAVRARCPAIDLTACCWSGGIVVRGTQRGDRVTLERECGWEGNGGAGDSQATIVVDLASCHASCGVWEYDSSEAVGVFDALGLSDPPAPPPDPPGTAYRADDPRMAAVAMLLTADRTPAATESAGLSIRTFAPSAPQPGRPPAIPATHLTAADLRALGVTPRPRQRRGESPARPLRAYRVTRAIDAPRETRAFGDHAMLETAGARCLAIAHRTGDTHQWVRCFPSAGRITWLDGDDAIAIGRFVGDESAFADQEYDEETGDPVVPRITFAIELATGRFHELELPARGRCARPMRADAADATLTLRRCRASVRVTLADLARALSTR